MSSKRKILKKSGNSFTPTDTLCPIPPSPNTNTIGSHHINFQKPNNIKTALKQNDYNNHRIRKALQYQENRQGLKPSFHTFKIRRIVRKHGIQAIYKLFQITRSTFRKIKDKIFLENQGVFCSISCVTYGKHTTNIRLSARLEENMVFEIRKHLPYSAIN